MKALYGIGNQNIFHIQRALKNHDKGLKLQTLSEQSALKEEAEVFLVPGVSLFNRIRAPLNASNAIVIVFDTPVLLDSLTPINMLDVEKQADFRYSFKELTLKTLIRSLEVSSLPVSAQYKDPEIIPRLLRASFPSVLKPVLAFLYSIPDQEKRLFFRFHILRYMVKKSRSTKKLKRTLMRLSRQKKPSKTLVDLISFLKTDQVQNTRIVLELVRKDINTSKVDKTCEEYKVSAFDVRYIAKAYKSDKRQFVDYTKEKKGRKGSE